VNVFQAERESIAGKLTAAGVTVTLDPRAPLPCVLVDVPTVEGSQGVGGWRATIPVQIIAAPPGGLDALGFLLDRLETVLTVFPGAVPAAPGTITRNDVDCPAYTIPVPADIINPTC
jgi:hypothetical protein